MKNNILEVVKGEVFYAQFGLICGKYPRLRPVIVIQNNKGNYFSNVTIVAMLIPANDKKEFKNFPMINVLDKQYIINYKDIKTIDKIRLNTPKPVAVADEETMKKVDDCLKNSLIGTQFKQKGKVYFVDFKEDVFEDYEVRGNRPGLILDYNEKTDEYTIALTTLQEKRYMPTHAKLENGETVFLEHLRTVAADKVLTENVIYNLTEAELENVEKCLKVSLAL